MSWDFRSSSGSVLIMIPFTFSESLVLDFIISLLFFLLLFFLPFYLYFLLIGHILWSRYSDVSERWGDGSVVKGVCGGSRLDFQHPHGVAHNSTFGGSGTFLWPPQALVHVWGTNIHSRIHKHTHRHTHHSISFMLDFDRNKQHNGHFEKT